jgi:hypothetical protein
MGLQLLRFIPTETTSNHRGPPRGMRCADWHLPAAPGSHLLFPHTAPQPANQINPKLRRTSLAEMSNFDQLREQYGTEA